MLGTRALRRLTLPLAPGALAPLIALLTLGCSTGASSVSHLCPSIASTGGDPVGKWTVTDSCQVPYAQTATPDWCSQLVYGGGTVKDGLFLGQAFIPITTDGTSSITYTADAACANHECGTYMAKLVFAGETTTNFPRGCLEMHTPNPTCADLQKDMQMLIDQSVLPTIENLRCADDGSGGCDCTYLVTTMGIAGDVGTWRVVDDLIVHYPSLPNLLPSALADIRIDGNTLELHGHDGVPLLAHDPLRNLTLRRMP